MPQFRTGRVDAIGTQRRGIQHITVDSEPAYVLTQILGPVQLGDAVVINTTAVDLGLGTGGLHIVHWNLSRSRVDLPGEGHIMKARYLSEQIDVGTWEESAEGRSRVGDRTELDGLTVVGCLLHSQVAALTIAIAATEPDIKLSFVMTDWASIPIALSDVVAELTDRDMIDMTVTTGHAFGGDIETVSIASGLLASLHGGTQIAIIGPGPGHAGTGSRLGFSAIDVVGALDMASALGARTTYLPRWSSTDQRERHSGLSHHSKTVMSLLARPLTIAVPPGVVTDALGSFTAAGNTAVDIEHVDPIDVLAAFENSDLRVHSMGRSLSDDSEALGLVGAVARWCIDASAPAP